MQIDWISGIVGTRPELSPGFTSGWNTTIDPDGAVVKRWPAFFPVTGSFENTMIIKTPDESSIFLSGNPVKFFQGHNLFGSVDHLGLFLETGLFIRQNYGMFPGPETFQGWEYKRPRYTRLDLTRSYKFRSNAEALAWIRGVASLSRSRHGASIMKGDTVYFGKHSRRWSFKIYPKQQELWAHPPKSGPALHRFDELFLWADGVVRFELTLRAPEIELLPEDFDLLTTWLQYFDRLTLNGNAAAMTTDLLELALKPRHRMALAAWRSGSDLRMIHSKTAFYRLRQELLQAAGVDIASSPGTIKIESPTLDPAGWDPEPIHDLKFDPRQSVKEQYGLF